MARYMKAFMRRDFFCTLFCKTSLPSVVEFRVVAAFARKWAVLVWYLSGCGVDGCQWS